jgi:hypothetical protein
LYFNEPGTYPAEAGLLYPSAGAESYGRKYKLFYISMNLEPIPQGGIALSIRRGGEL